MSFAPFFGNRNLSKIPNYGCWLLFCLFRLQILASQSGGSCLSVRARAPSPQKWGELSSTCPRRDTTPPRTTAQTWSTTCTGETLLQRCVLNRDREKQLDAWKRSLTDRFAQPFQLLTSKLFYVKSWSADHPQANKMVLVTLQSVDSQPLTLYLLRWYHPHPHFLQMGFSPAQVFGAGFNGCQRGMT